MEAILENLQIVKDTKTAESKKNMQVLQRVLKDASEYLEGDELVSLVARAH